MVQLGMKLRKKPSKYDRIKQLNNRITDIEATLYPDNCQESKETMLKALKERIDKIVDGKC